MRMPNTTRRNMMKLSAFVFGGLMIGARPVLAGSQSAICKCIHDHQTATAQLKAAGEYYTTAAKALTQAKRYRPLFKVMLGDYQIAMLDFRDLTPHVEDQRGLKPTFSDHYINAIKQKFAEILRPLPDDLQQQHLAEIELWENEALKRFEEYRQKCRIEERKIGFVDAHNQREAARKAESEALLALLSEQPATSKDAQNKGEYLQSSQWAQNVFSCDPDTSNKYLPAMLKGMGCEAAV